MRIIKADTGTTLSTKSWLTEAPLRMPMSNLDPEIAEHPKDLVVYGGIGKAIKIVQLGVYNKFLDKNLIPSF